MMKEKLTVIREVLESIEVHGKDNLRRLLACMNSLDDVIQEAAKAEKEGNQQ